MRSTPLCLMMKQEEADLHKPYPVGKPLSRGNITVLEVLSLATAKDKTKYRVRFGCCGEEREVDHHLIDKRFKRNSTVCVVCKNDPERRKAWRMAISDGVKAQIERVSAGWYPGEEQIDWAPPTSSLDLPKRWMPR
jgi:hypothetical protein